MSANKSLRDYEKTFRKTGGKITGALKAEIDSLPLIKKRRVLALARKYSILSHKGEGLSDSEKAFRRSYNREMIKSNAGRARDKEERRKQKVAFEKELDKKAVKISSSLGSIVARAKRRHGLDEGFSLPKASDFAAPPERSKEKPGQSLFPTRAEMARSLRNDKARVKNALNRLGKGIQKMSKSKRLKEQFIQAIIDRNYMVAESAFKARIGELAEARRMKKKQEVASKIGGSPFKGASMKHYKQQIRAAVRKMKAQTKIVDGPEKTVRHVHEETKSNEK